jgi:D-alanine-D-alanine ligase-like ATP-grasp enzyme
MNNNYFSKSSINNIHDLNELRLEHKAIFDHYAHNSTCIVSSWWSVFPIFYGQTFRKKRKSYWAILDNLFVPFVLNNNKISILFLPFGNGTPDDYVNVLKKCTVFCNNFNKHRSTNALVKWLNEDQLTFLQKCKYFDSIFSYQEYKIGPEYYYSVQKLIDLSGKEYTKIRRNINKFKNAHKNIIIRDYSDEDYEGMIDLYNSWADSAIQRYDNLFDKEYFSEIIKCYNRLNHIILVAINDNKIVGMISGEIGPNKIGYALFKKYREGYTGISEFLSCQLASKFHALDVDVKIINDGGAGKSQGLQAFKEWFRPIGKPKRYKLQQDLRILSSTAYKGPNIVSLMPSARVVVESSGSLLAEIDKHHLAMIERAVLDVLGSDLNVTACNLENKPILIIAQVIILIQQASRHEVKRYGYRILSASKYEITFEIIRTSMLPKLIECMQILYSLITFGDDAKELQRFYHHNRKKLSFTLAEYIANERKQTASRFGVSSYSGLGKKGWVGEGKHSQLLSFGYSEKTTAIGCHIARDKLRSLNYIRQAGAPVPNQINIKNEKSLQKLLPSISFPVVLKPRWGSKGKGVTLNINSPQELVKSYKNNPFASQTMVIQEHLDGHEFRLLVIDKQFIAAVRRIPACIVGDGLHSVEELINIKNIVERRDGLCLMPIKIDDDLTQVLKKQNLSLSSILNYNQKAQVRAVSNASLGGISEDCTDIVHPDNKVAAVIAAKSCLLDVAGIDFISTDISQSWKEGSGKIIEINNNPGVDLHMLPTIGKKREITKHFIKSFFNTSSMGSIPKIVITGYKGKSDVAEKCFTILNKLGYTAGLQSDNKVKTSHNEVSLAGSFVERSHNFLCNHGLDAAVMVWKLSDLSLSGSPCDSVTCTIITDELINPKLLTRSYDDTIHQRIYELLANITTHSIVIDHEDESLYRILSEAIPIKNLVLIFLDDKDLDNQKLQVHIRKKGKALYVVSNKDSNKKTLLWHDGKKSQVILEKIKPSKSLLFSLAAILAIHGDVVQLHRVLTFPPHQRLSFNNNSLIKLDGLDAYVCDPRDNYALEFIKNWSLSNPRYLWLIVTDNAGPSSNWQPWIEALLRLKNLHVIVIGDNNNTFYKNLTSLPNLDIAIEFIYTNLDSNDTVLFLDMSSSVKDKMSIRLKDNELLCLGDPFLPSNLVQHFQGKWLNAHSETSHINRVSLSPFTVTDKDIVVIPEYVNTSQSLAMVESAFENNCSTVVTCTVPENLPKWKPVLITENPFIGLIRLTRIIRSRMEGVVFAIIGNESMRNELCMLHKESMIKDFSDIYYSNFLDKKGVVEFQNLLLEIINSQRNGNSNFNFFFLSDSDNLFLKILKPNIVLIDTLTHIVEPEEVLYKFEGISSIYIFTSQDEEEKWRSVLKNYNFQNIVIVVVNAKPSSYEMNKLVEKIVNNENYNKLQKVVG